MTGELYFDETKKLPLAEAVGRAAGVYVAKHGALAQVCYVNSVQNPAPPDYAAGVRIKAAPYVQLNHYWAGEDSEAAK